MTTEPAEDRRVEVAPTLSVSHREDQLTIFDAATAQIFVCNEAAALIWAGLSGGRTVDEISPEIAAAFGVSRDRTKQDAYVFLMELENLGLLARGPA